MGASLSPFVLLFSVWLFFLPASGFHFLDGVKAAHLVTEAMARLWDGLAPLLGAGEGAAGAALPLPPPIINAVIGGHPHKPDPLLLDAIRELREEVTRLTASLRGRTEAALEAVTASLPDALRHQYRLAALADLILEVDRKHALFDAYTSMGGNESTALWDLTGSVVSHQYGSVFNLWDSLHHMFLAPPADILSGLGHRSILHSISKLINQEHNDNLCNIRQSPSQLLFNVYNSLQMTQLKAYSLMQFSWMYRKFKNASTNYDVEAKIIHQVYLDHLEKQAEVAKEALSLASKELKRCDPKEHIKEVTYTKLTRFLQGFLVNEVDLNDQNTCKEDCSYYKYTKQNGCFKDQYCSKQRRCQGNVVNCKFVDSDMWVCPSENHSGQSRRYDWIKYENGKVLGRQDLSCRQAVTKVDSWWRWLFWHCSYCMCICDESESSLSDRYFSLKETISDTKNNRVLTGLRLIKKDQVIHIQGQEGELLPNGEVNGSTTSWIPVNDIMVHGFHTEGVDYHKMSWKQRAIDLDDLIAPHNYLLTGVKWRKLGSHLNLEVKVCLFNFTEGKLAEGGNKCHWISNDNTDASHHNPRERIELEEVDLPTNVRVPSRAFSRSDSFIEFTYSGLSEDVSQEAVPFIDTQETNSIPPVPLTGAGIYHKGLYKSGGFIAPKVFTLNYEQYITNPILSSNEE